MRGLLGLILAGQALAIYDPNDPVGHRIYGVHGSPEATGELFERASIGRAERYHWCQIISPFLRLFRF
jgi:hypothetical protein